MRDRRFIQIYRLPLQSQDSGDGVSTQDWITNEKLGIDENNNSY